MDGRTAKQRKMRELRQWFETHPGGPHFSDAIANDLGVHRSTIYGYIKDLDDPRLEARGRGGYYYHSNGSQPEIVIEHTDPEIDLVHESKEFIVFKYRGKVWGARPI